MVRDAFVLRFCVDGVRETNTDYTPHGLSDSFLFADTDLKNVFTTNKRVTWSVTRLFGVFALLAVERPTQTKRITV